MHIFGNANWYFPRWLNKITPRVSVEPPAALQAPDEPVPASHT
jgi:RND superfamily putative drug exporter